ncbi:hypothetical protein M011DRAFT_455887 [Sporormia fimetaria CBS 119925]|uniref:Uncharacterized protein n=1 Tax=Sporormia fimetaria CBS 119925 TaxID=1340428 RepID=A0A6A6VJZ8_9PLEO|nr:hypothetical protein M011DRAFT_455887 [Sporormia fimetaria CBS 119925]
METAQGPKGDAGNALVGVMGGPGAAGVSRAPTRTTTWRTARDPVVDVDDGGGASTVSGSAAGGLKIGLCDLQRAMGALAAPVNVAVAVQHGPSSRGPPWERPPRPPRFKSPIVTGGSVPSCITKVAVKSTIAARRRLAVVSANATSATTARRHQPNETPSFTTLLLVLPALPYPIVLMTKRLVLSRTPESICIDVNHSSSIPRASCRLRKELKHSLLELAVHSSSSLFSLFPAHPAASTETLNLAYLHVCDLTRTSVERAPAHGTIPPILRPVLLSCTVTGCESESPQRATPPPSWHKATSPS